MPTYEITTESGKKYQIETAGSSKATPKKGVAEKVAGVGDALGLGALGRGFGASVLGQFLPEVKQAQAAQSAETQAISSLPPETLRRMAREGKTIQGGQGIADLEQATTQGLSNKQVIGSALSTALLAVGGAAKAPLQGSANALTRLGGKAALGAGLGGTQAGAIKTARGGSTKEASKAALGGAIIGGLVPVALEGGKLALKGLSKTSGLLTQQGSKQTQMMFERGKAGQAGTLKQFKGQKPGEIARSARQAVDSVREARNKLYQRDMSQLATGQTLDIQPLKEQLQNKLVTNFKGQITKDGLNLAQSKIGPSSQPAVKQAYSLIDEWDDFSVEGVDALKQQLGEMAFDAPPGTKARAFITEASKTLSGYLDDQVPGYGDITSKYADTTKAINLAEEVLNLRKKRGTGDINLSTAINKLSNVLKDNQAREIQFEALKDLSERSGVDLIGMVLSQNAKQLLPQGFLGQGLLVGSGALTGAPGGAALLPALAQAFAATSPRLASGTALNIGRAAGAAGKAGAGSASQTLLPQLLGAIQGQ